MSENIFDSWGDAVDTNFFLKNLLVPSLIRTDLVSEEVLSTFLRPSGLDVLWSLFVFGLSFHKSSPPSFSKSPSYVHWTFFILFIYSRVLRWRGANTKLASTIFSSLKMTPFSDRLSTRYGNSLYPRPSAFSPSKKLWMVFASGTLSPIASPMNCLNAAFYFCS